MMIILIVIGTLKTKREKKNRIFKGIVIFREQGQQFLSFSVCKSELCKRPHFLKWPHFKPRVVKVSNVPARSRTKMLKYFCLDNEFCEKQGK